jgi:hypothetical protein
LRQAHGRFTLKAILVTAAVTAAAAWPAHALGGDGGLAAVLAGAGVALLGAILGRLAGALVPGGQPESAAQAALVALGARLLSTASMALVVLVAAPVPRLPFAAGLALAYGALLLLEVREALAGVRADGDGAGAPSR